MNYPVRNLINNDVVWLLFLSFQGTFPNGEYAPSFSDQFFLIALISPLVQFNFICPEFRSCRREFKQMTLMTMPKAAMYKYNNPMLGKNDIW